jgi:hypothetical protein
VKLASKKKLPVTDEPVALRHEATVRGPLSVSALEVDLLLQFAVACLTGMDSVDDKRPVQRVKQYECCIVGQV